MRQLCGRIRNRRLLVQRHRIVHNGWDTGLFKRGLHSLAILDTDCVLRPREAVISGLLRGCQNVHQANVVARGHLLAQRYLVVQYRQLCQQDGGLQRVQTTVHTDADMVISPILTVPRDLAYFQGKFVVARKDRPAVAVTAQGFRREEAGAGDVRQVTRFNAFECRAKTLCGIFNDRQIVPGRDLVNGFEVGWLPIK